MTSTITVLYSCALCSLTDIPVQVPARADGEDVVAWMEECGRHLSADHHARSPRCRPKTLTSVKIPIDGTDKIGGAPVS